MCGIICGAVIANSIFMFKATGIILRSMPSVVKRHRQRAIVTGQKCVANTIIKSRERERGKKNEECIIQKSFSLFKLKPIFHASKSRALYLIWWIFFLPHLSFRFFLYKMCMSWTMQFGWLKGRDSPHS